MIKEISAGGVVYRQRAGRIQILLLKDMNGEWTFPKGLVEVEEEFLNTARREIAEEVGLSEVQPRGRLDSVNYSYRWQGELVRKTVHYYLFVSQGEDKLTPQTSEGIAEANWFSLAEAQRIIGYRRTNLAILEQAIKLIRGKNS